MVGTISIPNVTGLDKLNPKQLHARIGWRSASEANTGLAPMGMMFTYSYEIRDGLNNIVTTSGYTTYAPDYDCKVCSNKFHNHNSANEWDMCDCVRNIISERVKLAITNSGLQEMGLPTNKEEGDLPSGTNSDSDALEANLKDEESSNTADTTQDDSNPFDV